jgi:hypothetical protein
MKRIILFVFVVTMVTACSQSNHDKILGTWVNFNQYRGLTEITFSKNNIMVFKSYRYGGEPDIEKTWNYKIIDGVIFIQYEKDDTIFDFPSYSYTIINGKLLLLDDFGDAFFYTKRGKEKKLAETKKDITGTWIYSNEAIKIEFVFLEADTITIKVYDEYGRLVEEKAGSFELGERYLVFKDIELTNDITKRLLSFLGGVFLYKIDTDTLYLLGCVGGEMQPTPLYCRKL